jgi:hypothetical protein
MTRHQRAFDQYDPEGIAMPTFATPEPIFAKLDLYAGEVHITAGDRTDTVVEVRPADESKPADVRAAEQTKVDYADGRLLVKSPKRLSDVLGHLGSRKYASVQVRVELPAGSQVHGSSGLGTLHCTGSYGECELSVGAGAIWIEDAETVRLNTGGGDITVGRVAGRAEATTGVGEVRIRTIGDTAVIKNSAGSCRIGEVTGDVRVKTASGDIVIDQAHADVDAKTAAGKIRIGEVSHGSIVLQSAAGELEVGVREGTAAWLDLHSTAGGVRNLLDDADGPGGTDRTVEVRARTQLGDIVIRRSSPTAHE